MKKKLLTKNIGKNKSYKKIVNIFSGEGEDSNLLTSVGAIGSGLVEVAEAAAANSKTNTTEADNAIESINSYTPETSTLDALASSYNSLNFTPDDYNYRDFMIDPITGVANIGKATISGATSGATVGGGWGALIGGVLGGLGAGAGWLQGKFNAQADEERLERESFLAKSSARARAEDARNDIMANEYDTFMKNLAAKGGRIYIKPENRGKFTEYCGGKVTAECIARGKKSSSPAIRKRATFAANARKWHHSIGGNLFDEGGLMFQHGGIFPNGITIIGNGGTHEENPFEGVQIGVDNQGIPNMVEEGEVIWNDYVFSNRLQPTDEFKKRYKLKGKTFADIAKEIQKESEERPNDSISKRGLEDSMAKLMIEQELIRQSEESENNTFKCGGMKKNKYDNGSWLRYAPVIGSGLSVISDIAGLTNTPDYSNLADIDRAVEGIKPIEYATIDTKLKENPFDTQFYSAKLAEQNAATKKAIMNTAPTAGATIAGLLTADYNTQSKLGDLFRQAEEYNQAQRERVATFNRQTDAMNAETILKKSMTERENEELAIKTAIAKAQMMDKADAAASAGRSANMSTLFTNLGNIGTDILNRADRDMLIKSGVFGTLSQKPTDWSDEKWQAYQDALALKACGGKINRKKSKRGLTY